jgi:hypothetical protein
VSSRLRSRRRIALDGVAHGDVEAAAREPQRQLHAEDLQQAADLVLQVDALALHDLPAGEQGAQVVALDALHMHPAVPA